VILRLGPKLTAAHGSQLQWGDNMADRPGCCVRGQAGRSLFRGSISRDLIGRGSVTPETRVWSEGMSAWQSAGDVPRLDVRRIATGRRSQPRACRDSRRLVGRPHCRSISEFWSLSGGSLVLVIGLLLIIRHRGCWCGTSGGSFVRAGAGRPNLSFTGARDDDRSMVFWDYRARCRRCLIGIGWLNI